MNRQKIFLSSVQSEFSEERKLLADYIRQDALFSMYFEPFLFEELPAQDRSAQTAYLEQAANAEVYLLLMGEKYGFEDKEGVSPTEREYNTATANHAYRIAFIKDVPERDAKEEAFKQKIDESVIRNTFKSYEELQSGVYASLVEYMISHQILRNGPFDASIHPNASIDDLDKDKIRWFVGLAREKRQFPLQYSEDNIHQILLSLHLVTDDNKLKNAALLLFAKDVQKWFTSATIKCAHFYGTKIQKPIVSQQIYGGSVFEMVDMAVGFVMSRIDQHVGERTRTAQVDVTPELPAQAVTEAIVNAVVHRDYTSNGSVQVMLFKDRLEVWNPGKLPQGMTIAKLNKEHTSNPVNPVLANPVYLTGYIEQMGTGTTDIIDHCLSYSLRKPEFYQDNDFRVVIWRRDKEEGKERGKEGVQEGVQERVQEKIQEKVQEKVQEDGNIIKIVLAIQGNTVSAGEIKRIMNLKGRSSFTARYLHPSIEAGYVKMLYPDAPKRRDQAYYLTEKGLKLLSELS